MANIVEPWFIVGVKMTEDLVLVDGYGDTLQACCAGANKPYANPDVAGWIFSPLAAAGQRCSYVVDPKCNWGLTTHLMAMRRSANAADMRVIGNGRCGEWVWTDPSTPRDEL